MESVCTEQRGRESMARGVARRPVMKEARDGAQKGYCEVQGAGMSNPQSLS